MSRNPVHPELIAELGKGWSLLRLSVETPERVHGWDAVIVTAATIAQTTLYQRQLEEARRQGMLAPATKVLVVPDPDGQRIGSGGATFNALRHLAAAAPAMDIPKARVLLIHAGGDSKRLPWASVFGKPFVPVPLLADPDRPIPTLFDQLLALMAPVAASLNDGALVTLTGDVLPLFAAGDLNIARNAATVVTTPVSLDVAGRHGVILPAADNRVAGLLQKPGLAELQAAGALVQGGAALIDTGIYVFAGKALAALLDVAVGVPDPAHVLLRTGCEWSLYEEIAAAFVPAHRDAVSRTELGARLVAAVGDLRLHQAYTARLEFVHLGSSAEVLRHFKRHWYGEMPRRILSQCSAAVATDAHIYASELGRATRVGNDTLVVGSRLDGPVQLGNRCVVIEVSSLTDPLQLPDNHCWWQLPVRDETVADAWVHVCCGVDDNPKLDMASATFCNRSLADWLARRELGDADIWDGTNGDTTLWNARLFPVQVAADNLQNLRWMLTTTPADAAVRRKWIEAKRLSLAQLHARVDVDRLCRAQARRRTRLIMRVLKDTVHGRLDRNIRTLTQQLPTPRQRQRVAAFGAGLPGPKDGADLVNRSRNLQIAADLARAAGRKQDAADLGAAALAAVQNEVQNATRSFAPAPVADLTPGNCAEVSLPVRFDLAGGWSDTPPYSLERPAAVLNLALSLDGKRPVGARAEALAEPVWELCLDDGDKQLRVPNTGRATRLGDLSDPFILPRTALVLAGYGSDTGISQGVRLTTWADVPRGSGLGTSSILGAAVVGALQRLAGRPDTPEIVSAMVLKLEQTMTTGGGWQDQLGGLVPGIKFLSSVPVTPLQIRIEPIPVLTEVYAELHDRFVLAFSGQERLAKDVLQIVVRRYLQRDGHLIRAIEGLVNLAHDARRLLATGNLDDLGMLLREVWQLHQQLDPHCSNPAVDAVFRAVDDLASGYKLAGAGGGGFMGILAKSAEAANRIRRILSTYGHGLQVRAARIA